jgi:hypothetical protein
VLTGTVPSSSGDKQKQMQSKQQKKALLDKFAKENHFRIDTIERVWQKFHTMDDGSGQIDFDQFCSLLEVRGSKRVLAHLFLFTLRSFFLSRLRQQESINSCSSCSMVMDLGTWTSRNLC